MDLFGFGSALQGIGSMVGAGLSYKGAREANALNMRLAREQMDFQRNVNREAMDFSGMQAQKQMDFQERMSNTQYQRAMADMQAAGLNPILAFQQGGAGTPSGSSAQGVSSAGSKAEVRNQYAAAVSSALQAISLGAQIEQTRALTKLMQAELPEKQATADVYDNRVGKILKWIEKIVDPVSQGASAVSKFLPFTKNVNIFRR